MELCEWLGIAGMAVAFACGFVLAYMQGLARKIEIVGKFIKREQDFRERLLRELEQDLENRGVDFSASEEKSK